MRHATLLRADRRRGAARRRSAGGENGSRVREPSRPTSGGQDPVDQRVGAAAVDVPDMVADAVARGRGEVEALVENVAAGERRADEIPRETEQGGPLLRADILRAVQELVDERAEADVVELAPARGGQEVVASDEHQDLVHPRK